MALPEGYLEIYKLAVEMADRVSARRAVASSFFLTVLSTLMALIGVLKTDKWALAVPGAILALAWFALLTSYRRLNRAKYDVIQAMEATLPAAPYKDEWDILKARGTPQPFSLGTQTDPKRARRRTCAACLQWVRPRACPST